MDWRFSKSNLHTAVRSLSNMSQVKFAVALVILYAYGGLIVYLCASSLLGTVDENSATEETVQISPGMNATEIGTLLAEKGFIRNALMFRVACAFSGVGRSLKAGEYVFNRNMGTFRILRKIAAGEAVLFPFMIPEGVTLSQIAGYWAERGFGTAEDFVKASCESTTRKAYGVDSGNLEGYLFPDTYMFPRGISEREAIREMLRQFDSNMSRLDAGKVKLSRHEVVSLASIIEKEAKVEEEKPIISAVFHNRLKRGQKLESCATVLYGLGYPHRKLTRADLKNSKSPYNTYVYKGLPPGPICNPGKGAIAAALNPSKDGYLYFVSKNDGTHYFTASYRDFLNAKRRYKDG